MTRFTLMHKTIPIVEDGTELAALGVKILNTLFAGAVLVVEGPDDLQSRLSDRWVADLDRTVKTQTP